MRSWHYVLENTRNSKFDIRVYSLYISYLIFICVSFLMFSYIDYIFMGGFFFNGFMLSSFFSISLQIGIDGLSISMVLLTVFLFPLCLLISWENIVYKRVLFFLLLLALEFLLIFVFLVLDVFVFYSLFEFILLPLILLIGVFGKRYQKIGASYKLFFYTVIGSFLMFLSIVYLLVTFGSLNYLLLNSLISAVFSGAPYFVWLAFFLAFLVKLPVMPFHLWLPEAHVEAPTTGSVLLAGVLLKMGGYGIFRFLLPIFPDITFYFRILVFVVSSVSVVYASLATIRQIDVKKVVAYSSVAHMGVSLFGVFSGTIQGLQGSYFLMISHGIVSSGLFAGIGVVYDRYHTRLLNYYGGLVQYMPILATLFFLLILGNVSFPFTSSFIAEFLIFVGIFQCNSLVAFLALFSTLFGVIYSFWLYVRIFFGPVSEYIQGFADVNDRELFYMVLLVIMMITLGLRPNFILYTLYTSLLYLV